MEPLSPVSAGTGGESEKDVNTGDPTSSFSSSSSSSSSSLLSPSSIHSRAATAAAGRLSSKISVETHATDAAGAMFTRGQLVSPPLSSASSTMNGFDGRIGSSAGLARPESTATPFNSNNPSPPASIARSSNGASLYNGSTMRDSDKAVRRPLKDEQFEAALQEHYIVLRRYLASSLRDEKANPRANKARDKLLRLSPVQFQELSTDVFDELQRRQQAGRQQAKPNVNDSRDSSPPAFLAPKDTFHPKRNQARQKLSTLPPPRFRDLATDVFYELERRFPRFVQDENARSASPASFRGPPSRSGNSTPIDSMRPGSRAGGGRLPGPGFPDPRIRRPSDSSSVHSRQGGSRQPLMYGGLGVPGSPGISPNDYGRPLPKAFQSNTIIPTKSTMVEDSDAADDDEDDEAFGFDHATRTRDSNISSATSNGGLDVDKKIIHNYQVQVAEMREKLEVMEETLRRKDQSLREAMDNERQRDAATNAREREFTDLRVKLEGQLADALNLNVTMQSELDRLRAERHDATQETKSHTHVSERGEGHNIDLEGENAELRRELEEQQDLSNEVRHEAEAFLREMRTLTDRSGESWEREEQLSQNITKLEAEVKDWRNRYARTKTQLRSLRAASIGLSIPPTTSKYANEGAFTREDGLVKDVNVTKFQISIDELLQIARNDRPERVVEFMKAVVMAVRNITQDMDVSSGGGEPSSQQVKLKGRVSATANNLITAAKNFASAQGLSPVSLLDAAASHLTTAVVELIRTVKIRPTPSGELEDDDDGSLPVSDPTGFFPQNEDSQKARPIMRVSTRQRESYVSSVYSPLNSPTRQSAVSRSNLGDWASRPISGGRVRPSSRAFVANGRSSLAPAPLGSGGRDTADGNNDVEDLKVYLEDQTALLVHTIQALVNSIRNDAPTSTSSITTSLTSIAGIVGKLVDRTEYTNSQTQNQKLGRHVEDIIHRLADCKVRMEEKTMEGTTLENELVTGNEESGTDVQADLKVWRAGLPPIAFEVARETKELVQRVDDLVEGRAGAIANSDGQRPSSMTGEDDFS